MQVFTGANFHFWVATFQPEKSAWVSWANKFELRLRQEPERHNLPIENSYPLDGLLSDAILVAGARVPALRERTSLDNPEEVDGEVADKGVLYAAHEQADQEDERGFEQG